MKSKMLILVAAMVMAMGFGPAQASAAPLKLIAAHVLDAEHPVHLGFIEMDRLLKEKSGGQIVLDIFPNSQLGDEDSTLNALRVGGGVDLTAPSAAPLQAYSKAFMTCDFPYAFTNYDQVWAFYDGDMGKYLYKTLEGTGMKGLAWWDNGFRNFTSTNKEIHVPADLKGMKIRTMNAPVHMAYVNALGAAATPVPYGEVYSALQQGVVDGQENPVANIYGSKFNEVQKYLIMDRHVHDPSPLLVSQKTWDKLTAEQKAMVEQAGIEAGIYMRAKSIELEEGTIKKLADSGMTVIYLTPEQAEMFRAATQDVYKQFIKETGQEAVDIYLKNLEAVRK
ncbi:TRAP transporter substrate-binding protein [Deltaproteobacteria bacterium OttesenSCG-928-M10]|nr:TRAP transporter substrate-binding protein [Deltaproteobacteria bacterium OttesenSCG-928-M10]